MHYKDGVLITNSGLEIVCPDYEHMKEVVKSLKSNCIFRIWRYQQQTKLWPEQKDIPEYCLYLGSFICEGVQDPSCRGERYDLYHYERSDKDSYSAAIVYGSRGGDYISGSIEQANWCEVRQALGYRQLLCGLLHVDDLVRIGASTLTGGQAGNNAIRPAREGFKLDPEEVAKNRLIQAGHRDIAQALYGG
jgi:hypothetical protein